MASSETIFLTALGAAMGAVVRYLAQEIFSRKSQIPGWIAIGLVNLAGCLLIGFLQGPTTIDMAAAAESSPSRWLILWVSFCGGLTTFSTFSLDNVVLSQRYRGQLAFNVMGSLFGGWFMVVLGIVLSRHLG